MNLRLAQLSDAKSIAEIYAPYIQTTITFETAAPDEAEMRKRLEQITVSYPWIVLEDQDVIGYAYLSPFNTREAYQHSADLSIYLNQDMKHKGYGRIMCETLFEIALHQNIHRIVSLVTAENTASAHFHHHLNFDCQGILKNVGYKHDKWLDVSFYVKDLQGFNKPEAFIPFSSIEKEKVQKILDKYNQTPSFRTSV